MNSAKKSINTYVERITKKGLTKGIKEIETEGLENIKNFSKEVKEGLENLLDLFKPQENLAFAGGINSKNTDKFSGGVKIDKVESTNVDLHNKNKVKNIYERNKAELNSNNNNNNGVIIKDGTHLEEGKLKPNIKYKVGEYDYIYETDSKGRICKFETDNLQLTKREERLKHDPNTPGKIEGDHAGHLAGDRFGGSSEIDNLVSQTSKNNLSDYKKLENKWAKAIKENKKVEVNISIEYNKDDLRPSKFIIDYYIDGNKSKVILRNYTERKERLKHDQKTPSKIECDHAGHLVGDRFGGSPEIDNLVSQTSKNNLSSFKKLGNELARAIKENKKFEVNISIEYNKDDIRPSKFIINYCIDGKKVK